MVRETPAPLPSPAQELFGFQPELIELRGGFSFMLLDFGRIQAESFSTDGSVFFPPSADKDLFLTNNP